MWREWAIFAALPIGLGLTVIATPLLKQGLGALAGAGVVGVGAGALVAIATGVPFAALVVGAMGFAFGLLSSGSAGRWVSRDRRLPPDEAGRGRGRVRGGASGSW